jgi:hypothetical protein
LERRNGREGRWREGERNERAVGHMPDGENALIGLASNTDLGIELSFTYTHTCIFHPPDEREEEGRFGTKLISCLDLLSWTSLDSRRTRHELSGLVLAWGGDGGFV